MLKYDLVFVGNGILSIVPALRVKRVYPHLHVAIIGPAHQPHSASIAAGAMQAVFCEVEETFRDLPRDREIFAVGLEARAQWRELISDFGLADVVTAESTIMYRRRAGTPFEKANFEAACAIASDHKCLSEVAPETLDHAFRGQLKGADVVAKVFEGEFAIDTERFFTRAKAILQGMGVAFVDAKACDVKRASGCLEISVDGHEGVQADRVVVAAGTHTPKLLPRDLAMLPVYHAVGTAMVLDSAPPEYADLGYVIRSPNRGGAQCGMHIVPRAQGNFYLGAGNYLSDVEPAHRVETIRYLIEICESELYGKQAIYKAKANLLLGSRPKSMDGYPIVGSFDDAPEIFVATGTYRIGLTIAPVIANEVCEWLERGRTSARFDGWLPGRKPHSYATLNVATRYYSESRISNLVEHGLLDPEDSGAIAAKKEELEGIARNLNAEVVRKLNLADDFIVDPDMFAILAASHP